VIVARIVGGLVASHLAVFVAILEYRALKAFGMEEPGAGMLSSTSGLALVCAVIFVAMTWRWQP